MNKRRYDKKHKKPQIYKECPECLGHGFIREMVRTSGYDSEPQDRICQRCKGVKKVRNYK